MFPKLENDFWPFISLPVSAPTLSQSYIDSAVTEINIPIEAAAVSMITMT